VAKPAPGHAYDISRLNIVFAFSSIALFVATIWMVWADYSREWKQYQRNFFSMERGLTTQQIVDADAAVDQNALQRVDGDLAAADEALAAKQAEVDEMEATVAALQDDWTLSDIEERTLKALYDSEKFFFEEGEHAPVGKSVSAEAFAAREAGFFSARDARIAIEYERDAVQRNIRDARADVTRLEGERDTLLQTATLLRRKANSIARNLPNTFRNLPMVDFIDPSIEVQQTLVQNVTEDLNFAKVPRIDRCKTCHMGIDNPDYASAETPQPFRTHPNLELYVSPESPHPLDDFGCTSCHEGRGRAIDFVGVNHTPQNEEQEHDWVDRYGWKEDHYWDKPMYPSGYAQAGCQKCHGEQTLLSGADEFNASRQVYEAAGCWGCHNTEGFEDKRNVGPDLGHIGSKTTADWAAKWLQDPKSFKQSTFMPRFWNLENNLDEEIGARNQTEIASIVAYVFDKSEALSYGVVPAGDVDRGRDLVENVGCLGCHLTNEDDLENVDWYRTRGASLVGLGSKVNREFLYNWVREPKHYWEDTYMPDLRLTDREAADITEYLLTLRNDTFESGSAPQADAAALDEIALEFLRTGLPNAQAEERLASMSAEEKTLYNGENLIRRYGCFGCHEIAGFENAQKIGVDLSTWGSKMVTRLDFGYIDIEHTRKSWLENKLRNPRSYDRGKVKSAPEKLRMGYFGFSDQEIQAISRNVLGQVREELPREAVKNLDAGEGYAERARTLIHEYNCRGCHIIDGFGGGINETPAMVEDVGFRPPNLNTQGARTQADWLFDFLKEPDEVRFWLNVRMPTFHFSDDQTNDLVQGFMAMDGTKPFNTTDAAPADAATIRVGSQILDTMQCERCHLAGAAGTMDAAQLAPSFRLTGERLREEWLVDWMKDPQTITPGTQMPQFWPLNDDGVYTTPLVDVLGGDAEAQMRAVAAYLMRYAE